MSTQTWLDPAWRAEAEGWAVDRLAERGLDVSGPIEQPYVAPWATVLRVPTPAEPFWFKASAAGTAYEHRMFPILAEVAPHRVLTAVATDQERAWSLLPDAGTRLRDRLESHPQERFSRWEAVARDHAVLQRMLTPTVPQMLALGVPDMRPAAVPGEATDILDWLALTNQQRRAAEAWIPRLAGICGELAGSAVPMTVQQDDLHDGNVLLDGSSYRLVDWGDACVGHPFGVFLILRISLARRGDVDPHGREITRVRDAYLEPFTDLAPAKELRKDLDRAEYVQGIPRLCSWRRALETANPAERAEWFDQLPGALDDLVAELP